MRLVPLAAILGCAVALAQPQPETVSGVFQVVLKIWAKLRLHPKNLCNTVC
ncbi:MAG: hypothetical protein ACLP59_29765 [Bryobacteraceae bacterium]